MICKLNLSDIKNVIKIGKLIECAVEAVESCITMYGYMRFGKEKMIYVAKQIEDNEATPGSISIDSKLMKLLNSQEVNINNNMLTCGDRTIYVDESLSGEHEYIDNWTFNKCATLGFNEFKEATEIIYAADKYGARPVLNGLYLDDEYLVALDGYMLAKRKLNITVSEPLIIPIHAIEAIRRIKVSNKKTNLQILANEDYVKFYIPDENLVLISDRIKGKYPDYKSLIPRESKTEIKMNSRLLYQISKEYYNSGFKYMYCNFKEDTTIHSKMLGFKVKDRLVVDHKGNEIKIAIQSQYFVKALKNYKGEISINMNSEVSPILIKQGNKEELILPVRVASEEWDKNFE